MAIGATGSEDNGDKLGLVIIIVIIIIVIIIIIFATAFISRVSVDVCACYYLFHVCCSIEKASDYSNVIVRVFNIVYLISICPCTCMARNVNS